MRRRVGLLRHRAVMRVRVSVIGLCGLVLACAPDCEVAAFKQAECVSSDDGARAAHQARELELCATGETPTFYHCWEEVSLKDCHDAQLICAQYADDD